MTNPSIIYLAAPYTHLLASIRQARYQAVTIAAAKLIETGRIVYSPLTMTHPIDLVLASNGGTLGSRYWVDFDEAFMGFCSAMVVLRLTGWQQSAGVTREIAYFSERARPISYLDPDGRDVFDVLPPADG